MARAFLALGSNMGERLAELERAVASLRSLDPGLSVSFVYETAPVGGPAGQGPYLNCVASLETGLSPRELLSFAQRLEAEAGRVRSVRNAPRPLDVDILLYDELSIEEDDLVVPHPRMNERPFVLAPLEDLAPDRVPPGWRTEGPAAGYRGADLRRVGRIPGS